MYGMSTNQVKRLIELFMSKTYRISHHDGTQENLVDKIGQRVTYKQDDKKRLIEVRHGKRVITDAISIRELDPRVESLENPAKHDDED